MYRGRGRELDDGHSKMRASDNVGVTVDTLEDWAESTTLTCFTPVFLLCAILLVAATASADVIPMTVSVCQGKSRGDDCRVGDPPPRGLGAREEPSSGEYPPEFHGTCQPHVCTSGAEGIEPWPCLRCERLPPPRQHRPAQPDNFWDALETHAAEKHIDSDHSLSADTPNQTAVSQEESWVGLAVTIFSILLGVLLAVAAHRRSNSWES